MSEQQHPDNSKLFKTKQQSERSANQSAFTLLKVDNEKQQKSGEISSKLTIETLG